MCIVLGMNLIFRRTFRGPRRTRINVGKRGVSVSRRFGPVSLSTSGSIFVRIARGLGVKVR